MRILILGGTSEASALAALLAGDRRFEPTLSLAGRTARPRVAPVPTRIGGFGGVDGLSAWLRENGTDAVVDATHPFAARISANAVAAARGVGVPLASVVRPAWVRVDGDRWVEVGSASEAAAALDAERRRVFLSVGRLELPAFCIAPQHAYVVRTIEPVAGIDAPPEMIAIEERGPFGLEAERALLQRYAVEVVVSKNSGGDATYAKIAAARELGLPVVMIRRPDKPVGIPLGGPREALNWLVGIAAERAHDVGSPRGV